MRSWLSVPVAGSAVAQSPQAILESRRGRFRKRALRGIRRRVRQPGEGRSRSGALPLAARHRAVLRRPLRRLPPPVRVASHGESRTMWRMPRGISSASRAPNRRRRPGRRCCRSVPTRACRCARSIRCSAGRYAGAGALSRGLAACGQFYGHLYLGLYFEALGMKDRALEHIKIAAADGSNPMAATCTWWRACTCAR